MAKEKEEVAKIPHPRETRALYGHGTSEAELQQWWDSGRMPHAVLITGPKGIGKATLAHRIARKVLASDAENDSVRESIEKRILAGSHSDFLSVEPAYDERKKDYKSEIVVGDARKVSEFLSLTPGEGRWRVVIIDSADIMNRNAANSLLKVVEEPPAHALMLLVSHNPGKLLPTLRSRCRMLKLATPGFGTFQRIVQAQFPEISTRDLKALYTLSDASPGLALELHQAHGVKLYGQLIEILQAVPQLDPSRLHALADAVCGRDSDSMWPLFAHLFQNLLGRVARLAVAQPDMEEMVAGELEFMHKLLSVQKPERWMALWMQASRWFSDADRLAFDRRQVLFSLMHAVEGKELELENAA